MDPTEAEAVPTVACAAGRSCRATRHCSGRTFVDLLTISLTLYHDYRDICIYVRHNQILLRSICASIPISQNEIVSPGLREGCIEASSHRLSRALTRCALYHTPICETSF